MLVTLFLMDEKYVSKNKIVCICREKIKIK